MKINILLFSLGLLFCFSSCEKEDRRYQGPLFVEIAPDMYNQKASSSGILKVIKEAGNDNIGVQLIGLAQTEALTVHFRMADQIFYIISLDKYVAELPDGLQPAQYQVIPATAIYNTDYTFDGLSGVTFDKKYGRGTITVEAGSQFGTAPVKILSQRDTKFFFVLEDVDGVKANKPTALLRCELPASMAIVFEESFASDPYVHGWANLDKDGDGHGWDDLAASTHSITSDSYVGGEDIAPENYLVSPAIAIPANAMRVTLAFEVASGASATSNYYKEHYTVLVSEVPITLDNCRTVPVLQDDTELAITNRGKTFTPVSINMAAYIGKTVYISIAHKNCFGQNYIMLRNFSIYTH